MILSLIVAVSQNNVIGTDNKLPWYIPEDLKKFKEITADYPMIMGRKTFESLPRVLSGRDHYVITRNVDFKNQNSDASKSDKVLVFNSGEGTSASTQQFNITQENLEMLRQGRLKGVVEFYVGDVGSQGSLSVSLIGDDELLLMEESVGTGKVELSFTDAEVRRGTNLLIIKSSGLYELGSLKIKLVNR